VAAYVGNNPINFVDPLGLSKVGSGSGGFPTSTGFQISNAEHDRLNAIDQPIQPAIGPVELLGGVATLARLGVVGAGSFLAKQAARLPNARGFIREFTTVEDQTFFRVFSGERSVGSFLTKTRPRSSAFAREALDLPLDINRADLIREVVVPAGTRLRRSRVSGGTFGGRGGAEQFELLDTIPRKNFGPGVPFE